MCSFSCIPISLIYLPHSLCTGLFASPNLKLVPIHVQVDVGNWATFNCTVSCRISHSHTFKWIVGDSSEARQRYVNSESEFEHQSGIPVRCQVLSSCTRPSNDETALHQLKIYASPGLKVNSIPVQCTALTKSPWKSDHFSHYGVLKVKGIQ